LQQLSEFAGTHALIKDVASRVEVERVARSTKSCQRLFGACYDMGLLAMAKAHRAAAWSSFILNPSAAGKTGRKKKLPKQLFADLGF
jgi:hypothetical protein